jgi:hypothetical protein
MLLGNFYPGCKITVQRTEDGIELHAEGVPTPELTATES